MEMKKVKTYRRIKRLVMANEYVEELYFWEDAEVLDPEEVLKTKDEALKYAEHAYSTGYGTYSGRKLWQMPQKITRQIKRYLGDRYTCYCDE